ncbi:hypothetical protein BHM03_00025558, partial [Ensete ventricosum]
LSAYGDASLSLTSLAAMEEVASVVEQPLEKLQFILALKKMMMMPGMRGFLLGASILVASFFLSSRLCASALKSEEISMQLTRAEHVRLGGYGEERISSVLVAGTLLCDACLRPGSDPVTFPVPGARIGVGCRTNGESTRKTNWIWGTTDEFGEFMVDLPSHLHAAPWLEESCMVRVLLMPKECLCRSNPGMVFRDLKLSSGGNSIRVYSAGTLRCRSEAVGEQCSAEGEDEA